MRIRCKIFIPQHLTISLDTSNIGELESLFQLSNRWNVFFAVRPVGAAFPGIESKVLTFAQMQNAQEEIREMLRKKYLSPNATVSLKHALFSFLSYRPQNRFLPCYAGFYGAYIASSGDYRICCNCRLAMGNINRQRFSRLWKCKQVQETLYAASLMHQNDIGICSECVSCREVRMYSRTFHVVFSKIPYQARLLRHRYLSNSRRLGKGNKT